MRDFATVPASEKNKIYVKNANFLHIYMGVSSRQGTNEKGDRQTEPMSPWA